MKKGDSVYVLRYKTMEAAKGEVFEMASFLPEILGRKETIRIKFPDGKLEWYSPDEVQTEQEFNDALEKEINRMKDYMKEIK